MDLLNSLLVRRQGKLVPLITSIDGRKWRKTYSDMAFPVLSSSPVEQRSLPCRNEAMGQSENDFTAPPSAQQANITDENSPPKKYWLQPLDDFEKDQYRHNPPPGLYALPSKGGSESTILFHTLCQSKGISPVFVESEACGGFVAEVTFGQHVERVNTPHPSKKAAKDAVCKQALAVLPQSVQTSGVKRKATYSDEIVPQVDTTENWIGLVSEYAQREKLPRPEFTEFGTSTNPTQFACTLTIANGPPDPFGSFTSLFPTKQGAKAMAAKEAVQWLREQAKIPPAGIKRRRTLDAQGLREGRTGLSQVFRGFSVDGKGPATQRLHEKIVSLGLHPPTYDMKPANSPSGQASPTTGFWDVAAVFDARDVAGEPRLAGRIGSVHHVFGKQKAKDACCEKVLQMLDALT